MDDTIRIVIVDDHPMLIDGLTLALDTPGMVVVGTAGTLQEAQRVVDKERPDVVVLDLHLPDGSGLSLLPRLTTGPDAPTVVVLSLAGDDQLVRSALAGGASGYLVKGASRDEIVRTIRAVAQGQIVLGSKVSRSALHTAPSTVPFPQLSDREREVLTLLAEGLDNAAIGRRLAISSKTAANHLSTILIKIGAADRTQAALLAIRAGLVPPP